MYARVKVPTSESGQAPSTPIVPESAIIRRGSLPSVFIVNDKGVAEMRIVRTGASIGDGMVVISSGLSGNERIIDNPPPGIVSGWRPSQPR